MNGATREQIMTALLARLEAQLGPTGSNVIATFDRKFYMYQDFVQLLSTSAAPKLPHLILFDGTSFGGGIDDWVQKARGAPAIRTLDRTIIIYGLIPGAGTVGGKTNSPGGSVLQPLVDAVEIAMSPDDMVNNVLTLGGLTWHCWIEGKGFLVSGDIDPSGLCMQTIPVRILIP